MTQISVVVIDGQRTFADALAGRLSAETSLRVLAAVESVASASRLLVGRHVDIALLDTELAEGMRLATEVTRPRAPARHPVRVIMLGEVPEAGRIVEALRAGVTGWVRKEDSIEHLLAAIQGVVRDEMWLPSVAVGPVLRLLLHQSPERPAPRNHPMATLTPREREVLSYLADGIGRSEVAERMRLSPNTVRSHLQNLMAKLEVHTTLEAVALARRAQIHEAPPKVASWY
jgi:two-component system NarL family response regulator